MRETFRHSDLQFILTVLFHIEISVCNSYLPLCWQVCMLSHFSRVQLCATLWTVARQASLSVGSSRQEYWSGLPCPPPGDLPDPGTETRSRQSSALSGTFFTTLCPSLLTLLTFFFFQDGGLATTAIAPAASGDQAANRCGHVTLTASVQYSSSLLLPAYQLCTNGGESILKDKVTDFYWH